MTYRVELIGKAKDDLADLPRKVRRQIIRKLRMLEESPRPPQSKRLKEATHLYRVRSGDYRIVYQVHDSVLVVLVVRIGNRRDVYDRLPSLMPAPEK